jgi:5S rRNA maturation endonuclease (ribonuclease M5)
MLSCADFLAEFGDYIDDTAGSDLRAHLEEHLRECKTCQVIVDSTRKTIQIVTESGCFTLPADSVELLVREVMARVRQRAI